MLRGLLVAGGTCALVAGVAVAGHAAQSTSGSTATAASASAAATAVSGDDLAGPALDGVGGAAAAAGERRRCAQVPEAIDRTRELERLLAAGADTPGSLAYLRHRIDTARSEHRDQLVSILDKRLDFRRQLASFLPERLALLQKAQTTICSSPVTASPSSSSPSSSSSSS
ncbi:MAG TPA: hypothetical protein VMT69_12900 [Kineosporiaceae bacterium]|nr:hypothetical protein [Kineosporiaceae bacterium]